ncbi:N-acetylglutamate synthase, GNAT family [Caldanaerobius fijiensis DSM 17918]|uniref:N-acetylglutamate synthase, GNAT family n=2 Tax=Caldanaerobius TaxID=862261 RepID=A0A1M4VDF1_9THEO|nr:N-acetylglutamate synthase, GNAT family [Caldanaerobius fijiensis DSM 17918]
MVLMVDEKYRNKGIGHQLLDAVMKDFGDLKIKNIQLGAGVGSYIWPGVPTDLPGAVQFFKKYGFDFKEEIIDMVMELNNYSTPQYVYDRIKNLGIQIREADISDVSGILDFERTNFPNWYIYYKDLCDNGDVEKIHIAIYDQEIVGAVILIDKGITWEDYFGKKTGGIGCIGVAENYRNKGIGLALAARITESLKIKGFDISYVGYTWLDEWYGKLGYKIWRKYKMGYMEL